MRYIVGGMMIIFLLGGLTLIWFGLRTLLTMLRLRPHLLLAEGVVLRIHQEKSLQRNYQHRRKPPAKRFFPEIQFHTAAGKTIAFRSETGDVGRQSGYSIGQAIPILYDPQERIAPRINSWFGVWGSSFGTLLGGVVFIGGALLIWVAFGDKILNRPM